MSTKKYLFTIAAFFLFTGMIPHKEGIEKNKIIQKINSSGKTKEVEKLQRKREKLSKKLKLKH